MVVEVQHRFDAPPEQVFALLTDVERMGGLGPENVRTQWESDERGVGAVSAGGTGASSWSGTCRAAWSSASRRCASPGRPAAP